MHTAPGNDGNAHADEYKNKGVWRSFYLNITFVILLFVLGLFIGLFINNRNLIKTELEDRARSHFTNIVLTRRWNANHGGVFVEKTPGMVSNPYLENPDIEAVDGTVYTKKNPALMTREISELAEKEKGYQYHITSLNPLNPDNEASEQEKKALASFEKGVKESFWREKRGDDIFYRYMSPLYTEESCLQCHAGQGYKVGDVRGGISVQFNINEVERALTRIKLIITSLFILTSLTMLGIIYFFIIDLSRKLSAALERIHEMAITDGLTNIYNRRYFIEKIAEEIKRARRYNHPVNCILLDIDHFKDVNDTYGHQAGDMVLQVLARTLQDRCRSSDTLARYGGEEFILLLTETDCEATLYFSEKIRALIASTEIEIKKAVRVNITISIGVACFRAEHSNQISSYEQVIGTADKALYRAKENGRNRVEYITQEG